MLVLVANLVLLYLIKNYPSLDTLVLLVRLLDEFYLNDGSRPVSDVFSDCITSVQVLGFLSLMAARPKKSECRHIVV